MRIVKINGWTIWCFAHIKTHWTPSRHSEFFLPDVLFVGEATITITINHPRLVKAGILKASDAGVAGPSVIASSPFQLVRRLVKPRRLEKAWDWHELEAVRWVWKRGFLDGWCWIIWIIFEWFWDDLVCFHSARKELWLKMGYNISDPTADWLIPDEGNDPQLRSAVEAAQLLRHHLEGKPKIHGFRAEYSGWFRMIQGQLLSSQLYFRGVS